MTAKAKPTTGSLTDGNKIGTAGDTLKIISQDIDLDLSSDIIETTGDGDSANAYAVTSWAFVDKRCAITGFVVGGVNIGLANLGGSDDGVAITTTLSSGHTIAGNLVVFRIRMRWRRKSPAIMLVLVGMLAGTVTEAHS